MSKKAVFHHVTADSVFRDFIGGILASDGYLDATEIKEALEGQLTVTRLEQFRTIQSYNKKVDGLIDSYTYTRALYFYSELEKLILSTFTIWLKLSSTPTNFEEIGVGNLMRCSKVMKLFGFGNDVKRRNLYEPDGRIVLQLVQKHCLSSYDDMKSYSPALDAAVKNGLKSSMPRNSVLAFSFDGKELFHAFRGSYLAYKKKNAFELEDNLNRLHLEYLNNKKREAKESFVALVKQNSPRSFVDAVSKCELIINGSIGKMTEYRSLKKLLRSSDSYSSLLYVMYHNYFAMQQGATAGKSDAEAGKAEASMGYNQHTVLQEQLFLSTWYDVHNGKTELGNTDLLYKYDFVGYIAVFCLASLAHCLSSCPHVFCIYQKGDERPEDVVSILRCQYTDDIPEFALVALENLLGTLMAAPIEDLENEYEEDWQTAKVALDLDALITYATARIIHYTVSEQLSDALDVRKLKVTTTTQKVCPYCKARKTDVLQHVKDHHPAKFAAAADHSRFRSEVTWSDPDSGVLNAAQSTFIGLPQDKFIAVATSIILFHRIMFIENVVPHHDKPDELVTQFEIHAEKILQETGEREIVIDTLLTSLQDIECALKEDYNLPSFECSGLGSFLTFVSKPSQMWVLKELFRLKDSSAGESDCSSHERINSVSRHFRLNADTLRVVLDDIFAHMPPAHEGGLAFLELVAYVERNVQDSEDIRYNIIDQILEAAHQNADIFAKLDTLFQGLSPANQVSRSTAITEEGEAVASVGTLDFEVSYISYICANSSSSLFFTLYNSFFFKVPRRDLVPAYHLVSSLLTSPNFPRNNILRSAGSEVNEISIKVLAEWAANTLFHLPPQVANQLIQNIIDINGLHFDSEKDRYVSVSYTSNSGRDLSSFIGGDSILMWNYLVQDLFSNKHHRTSFLKYLSQHSPVSMKSFENVLTKPCWNKDAVEKAVLFLAKAQPGQSYFTNTMWSHYAQLLLVDPMDELPSLLQFIVLYETDIAQLCRENGNSLVFVATGRVDSLAGYDCCSVGPSRLMNAKELRHHFYVNNVDILAVSMCSAIVAADRNDAHSSSRNAVHSATDIWDRSYLASLRSCLLEMYTAKGVDAFSDLALAALDVACCLHSQFQLHDLTAATLRALIEIVSEIAGVNSEAVQKSMWSRSASMFHKRSILSTLGVLYGELFSYLKIMALDSIENPQSALQEQYDSSKSEKTIDDGCSAVSISDESRADLSYSESAGKSKTDLVIREGGSDVTTSSLVGSDPRRAFILQLLQKEFHYDHNGRRPLEESPEGRKLKCSLDLLSASLYSSDVHFVMELLQNADDNIYHSNVLPTLKLQLFPHALVVLNNEVGFSQENIVAVCNVGGSTKKGLSGYIGQKGIGFKSVFSISDRPEIHSNGFHVMFDKEFSMLEPIWLEDVETSMSLGRWPNQHDGADGTYYETCLRLALNEHSRKNIAKLTHDMEEVFDGKLILFLNKLQRMLLENRNDTSSIEHVRYRLSNYWTKIESQFQNVATAGCTSTNNYHAKSEAYWWTVRHVVEQPLVRRLGVEVASTEIVLAFKFTQSSKQNDGYEDDVTSTVFKLDFKEGLLPIYAFLPTLTLCFNFIIQADFVLATSRESIMDGNDWNVMLLDHIPNLFIAAIQELVYWIRYRPTVTLDEVLAIDTPSDGGNENLLQLMSHCPRLTSLVRQERMDLEVAFSDVLALIPLISKVNRHLHPCLHSIYDGLREMKLIPDQLNDFQCPKDILLTRDLHFNPALYVPASILKESCQKTLLHYDQQMHLDDEIISLFGIRNFDQMHIVECIKHLSRQKCPEGVAAVENPSKSEFIKLLSGLLYALCLQLTSKLGLHDSSGRTVVAGMKKQLVPTQILASSQSKMVKDTGALQGKLQLLHAQKDLINMLKYLPLWPIVGGDSVVSLQSSIVFVRSNDAKGSISLSPHHLECMHFFEDELVTLDDALFRAIDNFFSHPLAVESHGIGARPSDKLRTFLLSSFAPLPLLQAGTNSNSKINVGGLCLITPDVVVNSVILPVFRALVPLIMASSESSREDQGIQISSKTGDEEEIPNHTDATVKPLDRKKVAAFLAFIFLFYHDSNAVVGNKLLETLTKDTGILIPTLSAKDPNNRDVKWANSKVYALRTDQLSQEIEIHTGSEFSDSFTTDVTHHMSLTALRQLGWTVLDPLASALAVGGADRTLLAPLLSPTEGRRNLAVSNQDVVSLGKRLMRDRLAKWKEFLYRIGLVDFFKVYGGPIAKIEDKNQSEECDELSPEDCVPGLVRYLNHMLRYGVKINCCSVIEDVYAKDSRVALPSSNIPFVPLHLPRSYELQIKDAENYRHQQVLKVSKEVYYVMKSLVSWVACELSRCGKAISPGAKQCITEYLQTLKWCPVEIYHPEIYRHLDAETAKHTGEVYLLAAPRDVVMGKTKQDVGRDIVGPHFAYFPRDIYPQPLGEIKFNIASDYHEWYGFCVVSDKEEREIDFWLNLLSWKAELPSNTTLYSSVAFYSKIYDRLVHHLDPLQSENSDLVKSRLQSLVAADKRILWIPYESDSMGRDKYVSGSMVALSNVAKDDATSYFHFDQSPVKVLVRYYTIANRKATALFARNEYCFRCKAAEGMFGVRGRAKDDMLSSQPTYTCSCIDDSIGKYLSSLPGLISESPNLHHMTKLLLYHKETIERWSSKDHQSPEIAKASYQDFIKILTSISSNVWKCFHIKQALHPYSAHQLKGLVADFQQHRLLPGVTSISSFVSASSSSGDNHHASLLAIDDSAIYQTFRNFIDEENFTLVNAGLQAEDDVQGVRRTVQLFFTEERLEGMNSAIFDLELLSAEQQALLLSSDAEFKQRTGFISPLTFFAPKNMLALLKLLRIPLLSDFVKVETARTISAVYQKAKENAISLRFAELMSEMLKLTEAFIRRQLEQLRTSSVDANLSAGKRILKSFALNSNEEHSLVSKLTHSKRTSKLLNLKVLECSSLERQLRLVLPSGVTADAVVQDSVQLEDAENSYLVYLSCNKAHFSDISLETLAEVAIVSILQVLMFELALLTTNQQVEFMEELEKFLRKFANQSKESIPMLLRFEGLEEFYNAATWRLVDPVKLTEDAIVEEILTSNPGDELCDDDGDEVDEGEDEASRAMEEERKAKSLAAYAALEEKASARAKMRAAQIQNATQQAKAQEVVDTAIEKKKEKMVEIAKTLLEDKSIRLEEIKPPALMETKNKGTGDKVTVVEYVQYDQGQHKSTKDKIGQDNTLLGEDILETVQIASSSSGHGNVANRRGDVANPHHGSSCGARSVVYWRSENTATSLNPAHTSTDHMVIMPEGKGKLLQDSPHQPGRWNPNMHGNGRLSETSSQEVTVPSELLQKVLDEELNNNTSYQSSALIGEDIPIVSNSLTGRMGEQLAKQYLWACALENGIRRIEWCNEVEEQGLPYDLIVTLQDGSKKLAEVKTRSSRHAVIHQTWPISVAEVGHAQRYPEYFLILFSLQIDYGKKTFHVPKALVVGWQEGLAESLRHAQHARLLIRVQDEQAGDGKHQDEE